MPFPLRIIKRPDPVTKRDGQKIIIGLMAVLRKRSLKEQRRPNRKMRSVHEERIFKISLAGTLLVSLAFISIGKEAPPPFIEVDVKELASIPWDRPQLLSSPIRKGRRLLPIWIGVLEASAIEKELKTSPPNGP